MLRTLYVTDHRAVIRLRKGNIVVVRQDGWTRVPIENLEAVILLSRAEITNEALGELVRRKVRVAALSRAGRIRFVVSGGMSGNVHLRLAQAHRCLDEHASMETARCIVAAKIQSSRRVIQRWCETAEGYALRVMSREAAIMAERLGELIGARSGDRIRGIEGDVARRYFKAMAIHLAGHGLELGMRGRTRRPPRDPVNCLLSFLYGLYLTEIIGACEAVGLDPQVGFLHRPRSGRPSLALDLLEEFRPAVVDRLAVALLTRRQVRIEHFERIGDACYLSDAGRSVVLTAYDENRATEVSHPLLRLPVFVWQLPFVQATLMARHIRGDFPAYPPYVVER